MSNSDVTLCAIAPLPEPWLEELREFLINQGFLTWEDGTALLVSQKLVAGKTRFHEGWRFGRVWLGPRQSALAVFSKRIYFQPDGTLDKRPEFQILGTNQRPPSSKSRDILESQWNLLRLVSEQCFEGRSIPVQLQMECLPEPNAARAYVGEDYVEPRHGALNGLYTKNGFDLVPENFRVSVCGLDGVTTATVEQFMHGIRSGFSRRHTSATVAKTCKKTILERLEIMRDTHKSPRQGSTVLFVLPSKERAPSVETMRLLDQMDRIGVTYRRAYSTDPVRFSIPDQLPSLLMAANGRPHRVSLTISGDPVWSIGVDIGHDVARKRSTLCLSLVDPHGALNRVWRVHQRLDETAHLEKLKAALQLCKLHLSAHARDVPLVILRDGRQFEREDSDLYSNILGHRCSLFEVRKGGNPQILREVDPLQGFVEPMAASVNDARTMFVITRANESDSDLSKVLKVSWREQWNQLNCSKKDLAQFLLASTATPGLGLRPRNLPAPIYWADGVAKTNPDDLRFRGQPIVSVG